MARVTVELVGPSNRLDALNADAAKTLDMYAERTAPGVGDKVSAYLKKRPALYPFAMADDSPWRQLFFEDGRCFGVVGSLFVEIDDAGNVTTYGTVDATSNHVTIISNGTAGNQLLICTGHKGYIFDLGANTLTELNTTNFPTAVGWPDGQALCVEFMSGYAFVLLRNSREIRWSSPEDFTAWDPLDFFQRSLASDNFQTLVRNGSELWCLGTETGEILGLTGDASNPVAPVGGTALQYGAAGGTASSGVVMCRAFNTVAWIGQGQYGGGIVNLANGYQPQPISTTAVNRLVQSLADPTYVFLFAFEMQGHQFLVCKWPELHGPDYATQVYDVSMGLWYDWGQWNTTTSTYDVWPPACYAYAFQKHLVGDGGSGVLYEIRLDKYEDTPVAP